MQDRRSGLRAPDTVNILYLALIAFLTLLHRRNVPFPWVFIGVHAALAGAIVLLARFGEASDRISPRLAPAAGWFRRWYPLFLIPFAYKELALILPGIAPVLVDRMFIAWDHALFGVHPTVWLERLYHPLAAAFFQVAYLTYYFLAVAIGAILLRAGRTTAFFHGLNAIVITYYLSYLGYIVWPATGPARWLDRLQTIPLAQVKAEGPGWTRFVYDLIDYLEWMQPDCFPSGHTGVSLVVVFLAFRYAPRAFPWFLAVVSCLIVSTVYNRYHYVVDVIGGVALALLGYGLSFLGCKTEPPASKARPQQNA